jgi:hypothetical protein
MNATVATVDQSSVAPIDLNVIFGQIAEKIIAHQESIIGPIAIQQAELVKNLKIDWPQRNIGIGGNPQVAINELVEQYKDLFGQIAVETCKEAVAKLMVQLPAEQQPDSLK